VKWFNSIYNSPIFCIPKKQGQGLRIVQDFRELNKNSHIDKYSMKEIPDCIGDIGRANSKVFLPLDLTSKWNWMKNPNLWQPSQCRKGSVPLDHIANGAIRLPGKFLMLDGRIAKRHWKCHCLYWWFTGAHWHAWEAPKSIGHKSHLKINLDKILF